MRWAWLTSLLLVGATSAAAPPQRIAVLELEAPPAIKDVAAALDAIIPGELAQHAAQAQVSTSRDLETVLGQERQRALLGCSDTGCAVELAAALGATELLTGRLARAGDTWVLELNRLDARDARRIVSGTRTVRWSADALLQEARALVAELYPSPVGRSRVVGWTMVGTGAVVFLGGLAGVVASRSVHDAWQAQQAPGATLVVSRSEALTAQTWNGLGWAGVFVGPALAAVGVWLQAGAGSPVAVSILPLPGGSLASVAVTF